MKRILLPGVFMAMGIAMVFEVSERSGGGQEAGESLSAPRVGGAHAVRPERARTETIRNRGQEDRDANPSDRMLPPSQAISVPDKRMEEIGKNEQDRRRVVPQSAWEEPINQIRESKLTRREKISSYLKWMPRFPEEGKLDLAEQIMFELSDEDVSLISSLLLDPHTSRRVGELVWNDVRNRPAAVHLGLSIAVLRVQGHPLREMALENLRVWSGEDYGDNPELWDSAVPQLLQWQGAHAKYMANPPSPESYIPEDEPTRP